MESAADFGGDAPPSAPSLRELALVHEQLAEWASRAEAPAETYTPIIALARGSASRAKKMYEKKSEKKFVVLKEFPVHSDPREQGRFVRELFVGTFLRGPGLLTWSDFFFHKNVGQRPKGSAI